MHLRTSRSKSANIFCFFLSLLVVPLLVDGLCNLHHSFQSWAICIHLLPAICSMSSLHVRFDRPFAPFLSLCVQSVSFSAHLLVSIHARCPAHWPLASSTFSIQTTSPYQFKVFSVFFAPLIFEALGMPCLVAFT